MGRGRREHIVVQPDSVPTVRARTPAAAIAALFAVIFALCALGLSAVVQSDSTLLNALVAIIGGFGISVVGTFLIVNRLDVKWFDTRFQRASTGGDVVLLPVDDADTAHLAHDAARLQTPGAFSLIKQLREGIVEREKAEAVMERAIALGAVPHDADSDYQDVDDPAIDGAAVHDDPSTARLSPHQSDVQESYRVARHLYIEAQRSIAQARDELEAHNVDAEARLVKLHDDAAADAEDAIEAGKSADLFEATEELKVILTKKYD